MFYLETMLIQSAWQVDTEHAMEENDCRCTEQHPLEKHSGRFKFDVWRDLIANFIAGPSILVKQGTQQFFSEWIALFSKPLDSPCTAFVNRPRIDMIGVVSCKLQIDFEVKDGTTDAATIVLGRRSKVRHQQGYH